MRRWLVLAALFAALTLAATEIVAHADPAPACSR